MATLDSIAADQRAVLQMILQRGLGYDEIASLLGIDRAAVRQRALDGFDALATPGEVPALQRALITDYLLGQLPPRVADDVHDQLVDRELEREWAFAIGDALGDAASGLAPVHDGEDDLATDREAVQGDPFVEPAPSFPHAPLEGAYGHPSQDHWGEWLASANASAGGPAGGGPAHGAPSQADADHPTRRGNTLLLAAIPAVVLVAVVVAVVLLLGNGKKPIRARFQPRTTSTALSSTSSPAVTSTPGHPTSPKPDTTFALKSPTAARTTGGTVRLVKVSGQPGILLAAHDMPPNGAHDAYAIWLRNRRSGASEIVGYLQTKVGKSGKLNTEGQLPRRAGRYDQILVTLETQPSPSRPGRIVLSGPFRLKR